MADLSVLPNEKIAHVLMPCHCYVELFTNVLKCMAKHAVTYIVHYRSREGHMSLMISVMQSSSLYVALDDSHKVPRGVEYAYAMYKSAMCGTWIDEFRKSKLLDPPKTLKRAGLHRLPDDMFKLVSAELDQVMKRISDPLRSWIASA